MTKLQENIIRRHSFILKDADITLRPLTDNDFDTLLRWNSDPEVLYFSEGANVEAYSLDKIKDIYGSVSGHAFCFMIEYKYMPVGECWLQEMNMPHFLQRYPEKDLRRIDIMIGEKQYWGHGIGTKAIKLLIRLGFEIENVDKIFYLPYDYNIRSISAAEKAGFKIVSKTVCTDSPKAKFCLNYAISKTDYLQATVC